MAVPVEDFERRYAADRDPWHFSSSAYEQRRYDIIAACLPRARFRRGFEPGCSIGELTRRLVERCDEVVAWDASPSAVAEARRSGGPAVVDVGVVPGDWPPGPFDLVVLSEIGYYFEVAELRGLVERAVGSLVPNGVLLAAHWLGESDDHVLHGDLVHAVIAGDRALTHIGSFRDDGFRLDWWARR
jgi:SAM-dependent methyltransferase